MANIKQTVLTKKINGVIHSLYPKTNADIVEYKTTTVAAQLDSLISNLQAITTETTGTIDTRVKTACDDLYKKILGITDEQTTINEAYDTLKEVAEWIDAHGEEIDNSTTTNTFNEESAEEGKLYYVEIVSAE